MRRDPGDSGPDEAPSLVEIHGRDVVGPYVQAQAVVTRLNTAAGHAHEPCDIATIVGTRHPIGDLNRFFQMRPLDGRDWQRFLSSRATGDRRVRRISPSPAPSGHRSCPTSSGRRSR
jgi:hypothetical protein